MQNTTLKEVLTKGAEAEIIKGEWKGRDIVLKRRVVKGYRHPELDSILRKERTRKEARLIKEARKAGIPVPILYDIMEEKDSIVMEYFPGERVMDCIENGIDLDLELIGKYIGKLHDSGITHGDLTTSNILYHPEDGTYCFIDFSLGDFDADTEKMGVDLHLLREAIISVHEDPFKKFDRVLEGYKESFSDFTQVLNKIKDIESRGRYM